MQSQNRRLFISKQGDDIDDDGSLSIDRDDKANIVNKDILSVYVIVNNYFGGQ